MAWQNANPDKTKENRRNWQRNNPEKAIAAAVNWQKTSEKWKRYQKNWSDTHPEANILSSKKYYKNNSKKCITAVKKWRKNHPEKVREMNREWKKLHPEKARQSPRRWKLKLKQLVEDFTSEEWIKKVNETNGRCPLCGHSFQEIYPFIPTLDHTPPISKAPAGFHYTLDNVTPLCGRCNVSKGNRM